MGRARDIVTQIMYSPAKELGPLLDSINRTAFTDNNWDAISVKASYSDILEEINFQMELCAQFIYYDNKVMSEETPSGELTCNPRQAFDNLNIAKEFFIAPPTVENPNKEGLSAPIDEIDWSKPVFTADEVKKLLGVSGSTLRRWINGGWISYSQMEGSDKKYIQAEHLKAFFNNPKIFYPSTK